MAERLANLGYLGLKKETTKGTAVIPNTYVPMYSEDLTTEINLIRDNPIVGNKFKNYQNVKGLRAHKGSATVLAEPNTAGYLFDALMTKGTTTGGADPYTHPFTFSPSTNPKSYTVDISHGSQVSRFFGVELGEISPTFEENEMRLELSMSALGSFIAQPIASVTGSGPYTITLKTTYDAQPTRGLVVTDTIQIWDVSTGAYIACIVDGLTDTTITVSENVAAGAADDIVTLAPASPSFTLLTPFLWARTEFRFGVDAAAALSATQTRLEQDSSWKVMHEFEDEDGAKRSGSFDPAALVRLQGDAEFNAKIFFDNPEDLRRWAAMEKRACVIRHFADDGAITHELRVTLNNLKASASPKPASSTEEILYSEIDFSPQYDTTDAQAVDVKVLNAVSTI